MSSTTRVGFLVPDVSDLADETLYYDNNITLLEGEVGTPVLGSLPVSGNYQGRVKSTNWTGPNGYSAGQLIEHFVYATASPNPASYISLGAAALVPFDRVNTFFLMNGGITNNTTVTANGSEVFQASPDPSFQYLDEGGSLSKPSVVKFCCKMQLDFSQVAAASVSRFIGKYNIFIDPTPRDGSLTAVQPTPTSPGVTRLSFPIKLGGDSLITHNANGLVNIYGEMFWTPPPYNPLTWPANTTFWCSAYLSATDTNNQPVKVGYPAPGQNSSSAIYTEYYSVF